MKKIYKWILSGGITTLFLGGIAGLTTFLILSKKDNILDTDFSDIEYLIDEIIEEKKIEKDQIYNAALKETATYLYKKEQEESVKLQKMYFKWDIYKIKKEIGTRDTTGLYKRLALRKTEKTNLENKESKTENENKRLETLIKEIEKIEKSIQEKETKITILKRKIEHEIDNLKDDDYQNINFNDKDQFPKILLPFEIIKKNKANLYEDQKKAFIGKKEHSTEAEGLKNWILEIPKKYEKSKNKDEALNYLAYKEIENLAFAKYEIKINKDFSKEQKNAKDEDDNFIFPFLGDIFTKQALQSEDELTNSDKIIFLSNNSKDVNNLYFNLETKGSGFNLNGGKIIEKLISKKIIKLQHFLIPFKQNTNGADLYWKYSGQKDIKAFIIDLLEHYGESKDIPIDKLKDLFKTEEETKIMLELISGNSETTKKNQGILGIKNTLDQIEKMNSGFKYGVLVALSKYDDLENADNVFDNLATKLKNDINDEIKNAVISKDNKKIREEIEEITTSDFEKKVGNIFKNVFKDININKKIKFAYKLTSKTDNKKFLVFSQNGIHIVNSFLYDEVKFKQEVKDWLEKIKNNEKETNEIDFKKLFSETLNFKPNIIKSLLTNDSNYVNYLNTKAKTIFPDIYKKMIENKKTENEIKMKLKEILENFISNKIKNEESEQKNKISKDIGTYFKENINDFRNNKIKENAVVPADEILISIKDIYKIIEEGTY